VLEEMRIRGLGVIDEAVFELSPGFTVVTGETGAGKTMVVTSLGLLFGGRADSGLVRTGGSRAVVEGRVVVDSANPALRRALEAGAELDEGALLVSRTVSAEGRSRAHVGGTAVPVGLLGQLADDLMALHGQSEAQHLLRPARQRAALDRYAGSVLDEPLAAYGSAYAELRRLSVELDEITTRARERAQEADLLRFGLAEVDAADPQPGEDTELAAEVSRLAHAEALRTAAAGAHAALLGDPAETASVDAVGLLGAARATVEPVREHDPALAGLADRLAEASYLVADVAAELSSYVAGIDVDPVRLAAAQERQATLRALTRKYGESIDAVLAWAERARVRVTELDGDDERLERLRDRHGELLGRLADLAGQVSGARRAAARDFAAAVTGELAALAMPHARVEVAVSQADAAPGVDALEVGGRRVMFGPSGVDEVELLLAPHPGAPARPLARGASGGELSRVMLAVEVTFAGADPVPTFVFDEVDAGVGGRAAVEVGRRLATLARSAQVVVVTHLPQVAAFADRHLVVAKSSDGTVTRSGVTVLDDAARVRELSRMLAGLEDSELGQAHAEELLAAASAAKSRA
jgi:DNA repair protein RecN (Recombination protein N)